MEKTSRIFVAGHAGLLGSALCRRLKNQSFEHILTLSRKEVDYSDFNALRDFFAAEKPEYVLLAAGKTGGIVANKNFPADFLFQNTIIQNHFFELAHKFSIKALVFYSSSCVYPKLATQPIQESSLLTGPIEETSQAYAMAKLNGMFACKAYNEQFSSTKFICLLPNSIFGPNDNFDLETAHVMGALIQRFHEAKKHALPRVTLWGSGKPRREFIFCDDIADATLFALANSDKLTNSHYNVGSGRDFSIAELAQIIAEIVGFNGKIEFDTTKPDGTPRKLLDSSRFNDLGWKPKKDIRDGIKETYEWFLNSSYK
jgi:GDP-L-fucose synthase